jgi:hypothetical protein
MQAFSERAKSSSLAFKAAILGEQRRGRQATTAMAGQECQ